MFVFGEHVESVSTAERVVDGMAGAASAAASAASFVGGVMRGAANTMSEGLHKMASNAPQEGKAGDAATVGGRASASPGGSDDQASQATAAQYEWFQAREEEQQQEHGDVLDSDDVSCVTLQGEWQGSLKEVVVMKGGSMGMGAGENPSASQSNSGYGYAMGDAVVVQIFEVQEQGR
jgi:hypothetical protein